MLSLSGWGIPTSRRIEGDEKVKRILLHYPVSTSRRLPSKKTVRMGDEGKAASRRHTLAALLFVDAAPYIWRPTLQNVIAITDGPLPVLANSPPLSRGPEGYSPITFNLGASALSTSP